MDRFAATPPPPYYAVVFTSLRTDGDDGYAQTAEAMVEGAKKVDGFLGVESARGDDGFGLTVSYWTSEAAIATWREDADHRAAQEAGKRRWYRAYAVRVCRVERETTSVPR